ncbi:MAG: MFS transporter [Candidatus Helarchaeota archaeon]
MSSDREIKEKLPRLQTFAYSIVKLGWSIPSSSIGFLIYFYQIKMGLSWEYISLAHLIYMFWNAANDPLLGIMSDRTHHKLGRRVPYIRYGAIPFALSFILLWVPNFFLNSANQFGLFLYFLGVLFFYDTMFTLVAIVTISLLGELAITAKIRTRITFFSGMIAGVGASLIVYLTPMLLINDMPLQEPIDPFQIFVLVMGFISCISLLVGSLFLKEKKIFYEEYEKQLNFVDSIKYCVKNKSFMIIEGTIFCNTFITAFLNAGLTYYIDYVLNLSGIMAVIPIIIFSAGNFIGSILFSYSAGKIGIRKSILIGMPVLSLGFLSLFFGTNIYEVIGPLLVVGFGTSVMGLFLDPLIVDVADVDELRTGVRREAAYFGINALITKPAESFAAISLTSLLALFSFVQPIIDEHGNAIPQPQPLSAIFGIRFVMSLFPIIIVIISTLFAYFYPLDGNKYKKMKLEIKKLHEQKEKELVKKLANKQIINPDDLEG